MVEAAVVCVACAAALATTSKSHACEELEVKKGLKWKCKGCNISLSGKVYAVSKCKDAANHDRSIRVPVPGTGVSITHHYTSTNPGASFSFQDVQAGAAVGGCAQVAGARAEASAGMRGSMRGKAIQPYAEAEVGIGTHGMRVGKTATFSPSGSKHQDFTECAHGSGLGLRETGPMKTAQSPWHRSHDGGPSVSTPSYQDWSMPPQMQPPAYSLPMNPPRDWSPPRTREQDWRMPPQMQPPAYSFPMNLPRTRDWSPPRTRDWSPPRTREQDWRMPPQMQPPAYSFPMNLSRTRDWSPPRTRDWSPPRSFGGGGRSVSVSIGGTFTERGFSGGSVGFHDDSGGGRGRGGGISVPCCIQ